jgi:hypothetical protein
MRKPVLADGGDYPLLNIDWQPILVSSKAGAIREFKKRGKPPTPRFVAVASEWPDYYRVSWAAEN